MNELVKLGEKTYCLASPVNIGFYLIDGENVCLIDSGNSKDYGVMISKILDKNNWHLKYIINTHSHADHIGGNKYLQNKYNCEIFASKTECYFIETPILEPTFLYGASIIKELDNHFLKSSSSICHDISNMDIDGLEIIDLKGHSYEMIGILTSDNVLFAGDSYTSKEILDKYTIQYIYDVKEYLNTLNKLLESNYKTYIPSHGSIENNPKDTIKINIDAVNLIENKILEFINDGISFDSLVNKLFTYFHIKINVVQYYLISATIKAYISKLKNENRITLEFINNEMYLKIDNTL